LVPKSVPSTDQVDRVVLNGTREQREMHLFLSHINMSALVRASRHFLQAMAFVTIDSMLRNPTTVDLWSGLWLT